MQINAQENYLQKELKEFKLFDVSIDNEMGTDVLITVSEEEYENILHGKVILKGSLLTVTEGEDFFLVTYNTPTCVSCYTLSKSKREAFIYLTKEVRDQAIGINADDLEELKYAIRDSFFYYLQQYDRIVVHSASIIYRDAAWLFSAPSGTGKSTHVELWKRNGANVQDLNGDLCICYVDPEGKALAAGLPWCGTSGIYRNQTIPLGGVFFLKRSDSDLVVPLSGVQGILHMLARCVTPSWTKIQAEKNATIAEKIACKTNLAILYCTKEISAADVSKEFVDKLFDNM